MNEAKDTIKLLTVEEIARDKAEVDDFLRRIAEVPESERIRNDNPKFAGPIGDKIINPLFDE